MMLRDADALLLHMDRDRGAPSSVMMLNGGAPSQRRRIEHSSSSSLSGTPLISRSHSGEPSVITTPGSPSVFVDADYLAEETGDSIFDAEDTRDSPLPQTHAGALDGRAQMDIDGPTPPAAAVAIDNRPLTSAENFAPMRFIMLKKSPQPVNGQQHKQRDEEQQQQQQQDGWGKKRAFKSDKELYLQCADEASHHLFPRHIAMAQHIARRRDKDGLLPRGKNGKELPPFTYCYWLYSKVQRLMQDMMRGTEQTDTGFVVVEEDLELFSFFDTELPLSSLDKNLHGDCPITTLGYCIAVARSLLSSILGVNLACMSDVYFVYNSSTREKWSFHVHVPWPFKSTAALRTTMDEFTNRLRNAFQSGLYSVTPMFFRRTSEATGVTGDFCFIDLTVYSSIRLLRLPRAKKADKNARLMDMQHELPLWNKMSTQCLDDGYDGVSAAMVHCKNSPVFWNPNTVRDKRLLERPDQEAKPSDFRILPLTGNILTLRDTCVSDLLSNPIHTDPATKRWKQSTNMVDAIINSKLDTLFKLLYDGDAWTERSREYRTEAMEGTESAKTIGMLFEICRRSPRALAIVLQLWPHAYQPGMGVMQRFGVPAGAVQTAAPPPTSKVPSSIQVIASVASVIHEAKKPSDAFSALWKWRAEVEIAYSATASTALRLERKKVLAKLGDDLTQRFVAPRSDSRGYNSKKIFDIIFMDELINEVLTWSGQAALVFQTPGRRIVEVPLEDESKLDGLYNYCFATVCARLARQPEVPLSSIIPIAPAKCGYALRDAIDRHRERVRYAGSDLMPFLPMYELDQCEPGREPWPVE